MMRMMTLELCRGALVSVGFRAYNLGYPYLTSTTITAAAIAPSPAALV